MKLFIPLLLLSVALMTGCAGVIESTGSASNAASDSSSDSWHETQQRINEQMAVDSANAAAQQQFNDAMAATQQFENQHNAEFNQNGLH